MVTLLSSKSCAHECIRFYKVYKRTFLRTASSPRHQDYYEKQFDVLVHKKEEFTRRVASQDEGDIEETECNFPALLGPVWFLYHKMYKECANWFFLSIVLLLIALIPPSEGLRRWAPKYFVAFSAISLLGSMLKCANSWLFDSLYAKIIQGFLSRPQYSFRTPLWALAACTIFYFGAVGIGILWLQEASWRVCIVSLAGFHGVLGFGLYGLHICEQHKAKFYREKEPPSTNNKSSSIKVWMSR